MGIDELPETTGSRRFAGPVMGGNYRSALAMSTRPGGTAAAVWGAYYSTDSNIVSSFEVSAGAPFLSCTARSW